MNIIIFLTLLYWHSILPHIYEVDAFSLVSNSKCVNCMQYAKQKQPGAVKKGARAICIVRHLIWFKEQGLISVCGQVEW